MARVKTQKAGIETKEEFFAKVNNVAQLAVEIRKLEADRDKELQEVRERHEVRIQAKTDLRDNLTASCRLFAEENRADLFDKERKSATTTLAKFGFNFPAASLTLARPKSLNWDGVKNLILSRYPKLAARWLTYREPEVNKPAIKAAKLRAENLAKLGLKLTQKETFYIEPKDDETPTN